MGNNWIYENSEFNPTLEEVLSKGWVGFVYEITHKPSGLKYIGQKKFTRIVKLAPLKGKKLKRKETRFSDWKKYRSSSEKLKELHKSDGDDAFELKILYLCRGKAIMNYIETYAQLHNNVLLDPGYINGIVNCRINHRQIAKYKDDILKFNESLKTDASGH